MITGNKGEWSEVYALLKIIADKQLFAGDSDLNKIESENQKADIFTKGLNADTFLRIRKFYDTR